MAPDKFPEQEIMCSDEGNPTELESSGLSRRKFTRKALFGSAVLLTLGSRNAFGGYAFCVSTNTLVSFRANPYSSLIPDNQISTLQEFDAHTDIKNNVEEYTTTDGQTCYERTGSDPSNP